LARRTPRARGTAASALARAQRSMSSGQSAMFGGDEVSAIVMDMGHTCTKSGYAGEDCPKFVIPSSVGVIGGEESAAQETKSKRQFFVGTNALAVRPRVQKSARPIMGLGRGWEHMAPHHVRKNALHSALSAAALATFAGAAREHAGRGGASGWDRRRLGRRRGADGPQLQELPRLQPCRPPAADGGALLQHSRGARQADRASVREVRRARCAAGPAARALCSASPNACASRRACRP